MPSDRNAHIFPVRFTSSARINDSSAHVTMEHSMQKPETFYMAHRPARLIRSNWRCARTEKCGPLAGRRAPANIHRDLNEDMQDSADQTKPRPIRNLAGKGRTAVAQARVILLVMVNVAQLWILAATVEAALAHRFSALLPLVVASGICFVVTLTLIFWWRPASRRFTSSGYVKR